LTHRLNNKIKKSIAKVMSYFQNKNFNTQKYLKSCISWEVKLNTPNIEKIRKEETFKLNNKIGK